MYEDNFSEKEIDQLCALVKRWSIQDIYRPIDARKFTKHVKDWARSYWLLEQRGKRLYVTCCSNYKNVSGLAFYVRLLPIEVIWNIVKPMIGDAESIGWSIGNKPEWETLDIYPRKSKYHTDKDEQQMIDILLLLSQHHYIYFQIAGSVWDIRIEKRDA